MSQKCRVQPAALNQGPDADSAAISGMQDKGTKIKIFQFPGNQMRPIALKELSRNFGLNA